MARSALLPEQDGADSKKKSNGAKHLFMGIALALVLILGIVYWTDMESKRQSAEAPVAIIEVAPDRWYDSSDEEYKEGYRIRYGFKVDGQAFEDVSAQNEWYEPGDAVKVCYNPEKPTDAELRGARFTCGSTLLF